jgi:hypothetical protein
MTNLYLELPSEISPEDAKVLLAIKLWETERLSLGQAAVVAGYSKRAFIEILGKYGVPVFNYTQRIWSLSRKCERRWALNPFPDSFSFRSTSFAVATRARMI